MTSTADVTGTAEVTGIAEVTGTAAQSGPSDAASGVPVVAPTPAQTVGPFFGYALPFAGGGDVVPAGCPGAITVHGRVRDGAGEPVPDALVEFWQAGADGTRKGAAGSMRRDATTGGFAGRDGVTFTGFARVATDADGRYVVRTVAPGGGLPYLSVCVFARGLMHHLFTRAYLNGHQGVEADVLLASLGPERAETLVTVREGEAVHRFDIRLQGGDDGHGGWCEETVFLEFA